MNNPIYRGRVVWSRTKSTRTAADSNVRIVSDELWHNVEAIQKKNNAWREAVRKGIAKRGGCDFAYWLARF